MRALMPFFSFCCLLFLAVDLVLTVLLSVDELVPKVCAAVTFCACNTKYKIARSLTD